MNHIVKLMLAALATIALAIPAYALDFSVSGSMNTTFNQYSEKSSDSADAVSYMEFGSEGGSITFTSAIDSGDTTGSLSYKLDYDGDLDEVVTLSGSTKAGGWTASSSIDYNRGNSVTDQASEDRPSLTLTDGSTTIKMGSAGHLSGAGKGSSSTAGGSADWNAAGFDYGVGAIVDSFQGISYGGSFGTGTYTVALGLDKDASICGTKAEADGLTSYQTTSTGASVTASVGVDVAFTFCSGNTKSTDTSESSGTSFTTLGVGVGMSMGDLTPSVSFGNYSSSTVDETEVAYSGTALDVTVKMALGSDSAVFNFTNVSNSDENNTGSRTGIELGYGTSIGPATLSLGYGIHTRVNADSVASVGSDGYSKSDLEAKLAYSW